MSKYKKGDKVRVRYDLAISEFENIKGKVVTIARVNEYGNYFIEENNFIYSDKMLMPIALEEGDIVKLNPDVRLKDFAFNHHMVDLDTGGIEAMFTGKNKMWFDKEYVVYSTSLIGGTVHIKSPLGEIMRGAFPFYLFTLVRRPEKVKEITMSELEKHYGCKVKIVKENEK